MGLTRASRITLDFSHFYRRTDVEVCIADSSPSSETTDSIDQVVVALSLALATAAIEFCGFFSGITTFFPTGLIRSYRIGLSSIGPSAVASSFSYVGNDFSGKGNGPA